MKWDVPKGETKVVAGGRTDGRSRLEHLGEDQGTVKLRRTDSIEHGDWAEMIAPSVVVRLRRAGAGDEGFADRVHEVLQSTSLEAVYEVVTDPATLRPRSASSVVTMRYEIEGQPFEMRESRTYELDWAAAEGCGEVKAGR